LGHKGLDLGLRKRYIEDSCIRWGVLMMMMIVFIKVINRLTTVDTMVWAVHMRNYSKVHICTPQKSYVKYKKSRYYLPTKTFLHFLSLL